MKIALISNTKFLIKTFSEAFSKYDVTNLFSLESLLDMEDVFDVIFIHLDLVGTDPYFYCEKVVKNNKHSKIVGIRNAPDFGEGCRLLKIGLRGYANSMSHQNIFTQILDTVNQGNLWVYPELMQYMVSSVPHSDQNNENLLSVLTPKEKEIALLVSEGASNQKISEALDIAEITVKKHLTVIFSKLNVKDRLGLALLVRGK